MGKPHLISIVDDDVSVREAVHGLLRSLGYQAAAFESAEQFLQSDNLDDTSCVISDLQMPGKSGLDLQDELLSKGRTLPMIIITAHPTERERTRALQSGALAFLDKPFDEEVLISCLEEAVPL